MNQRKAFTLVELLVVVTIIGVLLALLIPAMNKAIYQAELLRCATRQRSVTSALTLYAFDHKRHYPYRGVIDEEPDQEQMNFLNPMQVSNPLRQYDVRPPLKGYVPSINGQLQCPLIEPSELENELVGSNLETSYMMMWGWVYQVGNIPEKGMFKLGDKVSWTARSGNRRKGEYSVLLADMDVRYGNSYMQSSHPDYGPVKMEPFVWKDRFEFGRFWTLSRWSTPLREQIRGLLDTNFAYDDGSVQRYHGVRGPADPQRDDRMDDLPLEYDQQNAINYFQVPNQ